MVSQSKYGFLNNGFSIKIWFSNIVSHSKLGNYIFKNQPLIPANVHKILIPANVHQIIIQNNQKMV